MISDPCPAKYVLNSPLFTLGAAQEKGANFLLGYGSVFLAHGTVPTISLILLLNTAQVTDTDSFEILWAPTSPVRASVGAFPRCGISL
jgi:hypothetical protein